MNDDHVQTKTEIQETLLAAGLRPRKRFGQHFLIDGNLMRRLVDLADLQATDVVLEVGPGTGGLTDLLARRVAKVMCVEIDRDLHALLEARFDGNDRVDVICGDALESKHKINAMLADRLAPYRQLPHAERPDIKLVANLPYQAATPLVMNLLVDYPIVTTLCFSVQLEVGLRMTADAGTRDYGPLSVISKLIAEVEIASRLRPEVFWPRPAVDSVLVVMRRRSATDLAPEEFRDFARFIRSHFDQRRKTLRSILKQALGADTADRMPWQELGITPDMRPQSLSLDCWLRFYRYRQTVT